MLNFRTDNLRGDLYGGLTAGVVALPLALAFGEASGAGPIAGLYGAIFVGFFAALFGGTETQISGPTGPMIVVFAGVYATLNGEAGVSLRHRNTGRCVSNFIWGAKARPVHQARSLSCGIRFYERNWLHYHRIAI